MTTQEKITELYKIPSAEFALIENKKTFETFSGDADIFAGLLNLPTQNIYLDNGIFGKEKIHYLRFEKSLFPLLKQKFEEMCKRVSGKALPLHIIKNN